MEKKGETGSVSWGDNAFERKKGHDFGWGKKDPRKTMGFASARCFCSKEKRGGTEKP